MQVGVWGGVLRLSFRELGGEKEGNGDGANVRRGGTLGSYPAMQSFLYFLILAAWSAAWKMLPQEGRWWIRCSNADVDSLLVILVGVYHQPHRISGRACYSHGHVLDHLEQSQNEQQMVVSWQIHCHFFHFRSGQAVISRCRKTCLPLLSWAEKPASQVICGKQNKRQLMKKQSNISERRWIQELLLLVPRWKLYDNMIMISLVANLTQMDKAWIKGDVGPCGQLAGPAL